MPRFAWTMDYEWSHVKVGCSSCVRSQEDAKYYFLSDELMISRKPCGVVLAGIIKKENGGHG
jgi:formate dehydrogenase maturation protein FdhE